MLGRKGKPTGRGTSRKTGIAPTHYSREKVTTRWRPPVDEATERLEARRQAWGGAKEIMTFALAFCVGMCLILSVVYVVVLGPERQQMMVGRPGRRTDIGFLGILLFGAVVFVVLSLLLVLLTESKTVLAWFRSAGDTALMAVGFLSGACLTGGSLWLLW